MKEIQLEHLFSSDKDAHTFNYFEWALESYELTGKSVLDLGTGHGKYAIKCRDYGMRVTAMDGRPDRIPFHEKNIDWQVADVNEYDLSGYDVVLFLGLLYHLTYDQQISIFNKLDCDYLIINTHFARKEGNEILCLRPDRLTPDYSKGGLIYRECHKLEELKSRPLAALNNYTAFWPTLETLEKMLDNAGFDMQMLMPCIYDDRTFFICKKQINE